MAASAEIYPFLINSAFRPLPTACQDGDITVVDLLPGEKDVRGPMRFMAISARQDISGVIGIRSLELCHAGVVIAGISEAMLFDIPVKSIKVSPQYATINSVGVIMTISTKSNIIGQVGAVFNCGTIWFVS